MSNDESKSPEGSKRTLFQAIVNSPDEVIVGRVAESEKTTPETGMDRLRKMFELDQYGYQSKEFIMITQCFYATTIGGGIIGAIVESRNTFMNFLENNQATKFHSHLDAKRELQRVMYLAFGRGAWRWGWRIGLFSTTFTSLMTTVSVYRGKESILEYLIAGGVAGAMYKMNMGLKGAFSGCLAGTFLGGLTGGASLLVLKIGGLSMEEIRTFSKLLKENRDYAIRQKSAEATLTEYQFESKLNKDDSLFKNLEVDEVEEVKTT